MTHDPSLPENSIHPKTSAEWRSWLANHHQRPQGVWVISYKKSTGLPRLDYDAIVEEALCFGWVDSKPSKLDADRSMLWCAPRKPKSSWSRLNKERVARLTAAGRMTEAGLRAVEIAKANGAWAALDAVENLVVPADLQAAFARYTKAAGYFGTFPRSVQRAILEWVGNAKRPETRAKRVEETARLANENVRANQWRQ